MNLNKLARTVLKTGLYVLEQSDKATAEIRERVKDQVEDVTDRTRQAILGQEDHSVRNIISLAAGVGLGVVVAMLFAPASGEEIRRQVVEKAQSTRARVRERFSPKETSDETGER
jgi:YtxH-like protein